MGLYEKLLAGEEKLSLVGLGYVGMPIAVAYAKKIKVVGYDFNAAKVELYKKGLDPKPLRIQVLSLQQIPRSFVSVNST